MKLTGKGQVNFLEVISTKTSQIIKGQFSWIVKDKNDEVSFQNITVIFVGKAVEYVKENIKNKDVIEVKNSLLAIENYTDKNGVARKAVQVKIFECEKIEKKENTGEFVEVPKDANFFN